MTRVLSGDNLRVDFNQVVANRGSAGVDGMEVDELGKYLYDHFGSLKQSLVSGSYVPQAVLGVEIPKANGGIRQLGIPTVIDRMIQQSIHQVLSQIWDPTFSEYSYGFRPRRNAAQALAQATDYINAGYQHIIDLDLKSFFDMVDHDKIMGLLRRKISDKILLGLIRKYLQAGVMCNGHYSKRGQGTPQGGPSEHIEEELETAEGENQIDHKEDASDSLCGTDRKIELTDVGMG